MGSLYVLLSHCQEVIILVRSHCGNQIGMTSTPSCSHMQQTSGLSVAFARAGNAPCGFGEGRCTGCRGRKEEGCDAAVRVYGTPKMAGEVTMIDLALVTLFNMFGAALCASRLAKSCMIDNARHENAHF